MSGKDSLKYCTVPLGGIIASLREAERFLRRELSYPSAHEILNYWDDQYPVDTLQALQNEEEIGQALRDTATKAVLSLFHDIFECRALLAPDDRNASGGKTNFEIYRDLAAWGGFTYTDDHDEKINAHWLDLKRDISLYLIPQYLELIAADMSKAQTMRLTAAMEEIRSVRPDEAQESIRRIGRMREIYRAGGFDEVQAHLEMCQPRILDTIRKGLYAAAGLELKRELLERFSPLQRYGLVVKPDPERFNGAEFWEAKEELDETLKPFLQREWVRAVEAAAPLTYDGTPVGIMFVATRDVAQEVANVHHDEEVINWLGERLWPGARGVWGTGFSPPDP